MARTLGVVQIGASGLLCQDNWGAVVVAERWFSAGDGGNANANTRACMPRRVLPHGLPTCIPACRHAPLCHSAASYFRADFILRPVPRTTYLQDIASKKVMVLYPIALLYGYFLSLHTGA